MRSVVGEWITNIVVIAILGALVDMILPNSSFRKYTGFIFGLVILVMFLQPILKFLDQAQNFDGSVFRNALALNTQTAAFQGSQLEEKQKQQLENLFKKNLERDLAFQLKEAAGLESASVIVTFCKERGETDLSSIERIDVTADTKEQAVFIKPIIIGTGQDSKTGPAMDSERTAEIKGILSNLCELDEDKILVNGK
jgi:stage III sporulation protein AF